MSIKLKIACLMLAVAGFAVVSQGALRVRYSYCANHIDTAGPNCDKPKRDPGLREKIIPGIWDNYSATNAFDNVSDQELGELSNAPFVSGTWWVDSIYDPMELRKGAPFVEGLASVSQLLKPSYTLSGDGYIAYVAGGINIPTPGTYTFKFTYNDGFVSWIDKNEDGQITFNDMTDALSGVRDGNGSWSYDKTKDAEGITVTFSKAGYHKIMMWYWDWGELGHLTIDWKVPGSTAFKPVVASDFGKKRNPGLPAVSITDMWADGAKVDQSSWGFYILSSCTKLTFKAAATNMVGQAPVYIWSFGDTSATFTTTADTISYRYAKDGSYSPSVKVKRDNIISEKSGTLISVFAMGLPPCTRLPVAVVNQSHKKITGRTEIQGSILRTSIANVGFEIINVNGRTIRSIMSKDGIIDLQGVRLPMGKYFVKIKSNGNMVESIPVLLN